MCDRNPLHCIIPPYLADQLARSEDPEIRKVGTANLEMNSSFRTMRIMAEAMPKMMIFPALNGGKSRRVYDAGGRSRLPGTLVRGEGDPPTNDRAADEAYDGSGDTYDFYEVLFGRNSMDDGGMELISSVHVGASDQQGHSVPMNNAFWNGEQMAYGDGDGKLFDRFTASLDVIAHELTHGVVSFTSNLKYYGQSGALNEHFADVFGILVRKWKSGESDENWLIGRELWKVPGPLLRGIRDMENPGTAYNDPRIGRDQQPSHMSGYYNGPYDNQGVHINSGIPNRAFVLAAQAIGGQPWEIPGRIWYDTMRQLSTNSEFKDCAEVSIQIAAKYGSDVAVKVEAAWRSVGVLVPATFGV